MWGVVAPLKRFVHHGGVMYAYWVADKLREEHNLTNVELSLLMYLYHVSGGGRQVIDGVDLLAAPSFPCSYNYWMVLSGQFKQRGYIVRSVRNPAKPYTSGYRAKGMRYIRLTDKAINLIHDMDRELYRRLRSCTFNDVVCGYGKGQI